MGLIKEFKEFAMRGNVMDMAVGVIIGGAFGKIVTSMVNDMIMPLVGSVTGGNLAQNFIWFGEGEKPATMAKAKEMGGAYLGWGNFLQTTIDFLIVAACIFLMIKLMNKAQSATGFGAEEKKDEAPAPPPEDIQLLREIRDSLAQNR